MEQNGSQNLAFLLAVQYENVRLCEVMGATPHSAVQLKINFVVVNRLAFTSLLNIAFL